jgi:pterin-4a-carbinolamine dehydratase
MGELPRHKLSDAELQEALKSLPGWKAENDKLHVFTAPHQLGVQF